MKVYTHGTNYKDDGLKAVCPKCKCKFGYLENELKKDKDKESNSTKYYINCPECSNKVTTKIVVGKLKIKQNEPHKFELSDLFTPFIRFYHCVVRENFYKLKYKLQRFHKGYADEDLFSLDYWFRDTFTKMLDEFQFCLVGAPDDYKEEIEKVPYELQIKFYDEILSEMRKYKFFEGKEITYETEPMDDCYIQWRMMLKYIIYCIKQTDEDAYRDDTYYKQYTELDDIISELKEQGLEVSKDKEDELEELKQKWFAQLDREYQYRCYMAQTAFNLIGKYFGNLWN